MVAWLKCIHNQVSCHRGLAQTSDPAVQYPGMQTSQALASLWHMRGADPFKPAIFSEGGGAELICQYMSTWPPSGLTFSGVPYLRRRLRASDLRGLMLNCTLQKLHAHSVRYGGPVYSDRRTTLTHTCAAQSPRHGSGRLINLN